MQGQSQGGLWGLHHATGDVTGSGSEGHTLLKALGLVAALPHFNSLLLLARSQATQKPLLTLPGPAEISPPP